MAYRHGTDCDVIAAQEAMLRLAERDHQLSTKRLEAETGIPAVTLRGYKRDVMMPLSAFVKLCRVIPDDLTSLCLEPSGKHVGTDEAGDGDLDALARESAGYNVEYLDARDPNSEAGAAIGPREAARLKERARRMAATARRAA